MFVFTQEQYDEFKSWLQELNKTMAKESWPAEEDYLTYPGLPKYELYQYQVQRDFATVIVFEEMIRTPHSINDRFTVSDFNQTIMF